MSIGVFDSGVGGLTVHRALVNRLPQADFVYLADQANAPYGGRPARRSWI
jgi:glutamate racemase